MLAGCGHRATSGAPRPVAPASAAQSAGALPPSVPLGLVRVSDGDGRVGFIDHAGTVLLPPLFAPMDVLGESEGLVAVREHGS